MHFSELIKQWLQ